MLKAKDIDAYDSLGNAFNTKKQEAVKTLFYH